MSSRQLLLIRHGLSALDPPPGLLALADIECWRDAYNVTGIAPHSQPPSHLVTAVGGADMLAASDLPRAIESAGRLAPGRAVTTLPVFREFDLTIPRWSACPMPFTAWAVLVHLRWAMDILGRRDAPPEVAARAGEAAAWCHDACLGSTSGGAVAVVTHGAFRRLLAKQLVRDGWRPSAARRSYAHWSVWRFDLPAR